MALLTSTFQTRGQTRPRVNARPTYENFMVRGVRNRFERCYSVFSRTKFLVVRGVIVPIGSGVIVPTVFGVITTPCKIYFQNKFSNNF